MADGFDIHLDDESAAQLRAEASMADMSPEEYAALLIGKGLARA
ncbi:hypothetical protein BH10PSE3_BH10PSE3_21450 [soil metagenome]